jgi:CheY-like chemotaxis protein
MANKILLVEDSMHDAELTLHALKDCRISNPAIHADDGAVGLWHLAVNSEIALVLLDLKLQIVDGFEVLKIMRADPKLVEMPVIIVTGSELGSDFVRAKMLGASGCAKRF